MNFLRSEKNLADPLTKPLARTLRKPPGAALPKGLFRELVDVLQPLSQKYKVQRVLLYHAFTGLSPTQPKSNEVMLLQVFREYLILEDFRQSHSTYE
ncbi:hypothetical protein PIB30_013845 [Stylosanthes scabra]|uniref:Uncharacterized protein n=1 Tax=Stylosanthes scabra TaxID=79078 RepID=A0ABU6T6T0_9FABA|nr:hypothetical protein [Stylosanthes scabra]